MIDKLMKMKKKEGKLSDVEKDAKLSVLQDLKSQAEDSLAGKLKGLKKVTVAAGSPSDLKKGLDKAKEIIGDMPEMEEAEEEAGEDLDADEEMHEDHGEEEALTEEELDAKLQKLMAMKEKMKAAKV
jgi:hypothetical protein